MESTDSTGGKSNQKIVNERIEQIMLHYSLNKNSFSNKIGLTNNVTIGNIVGGRRSKPSFDVLQKIIETFPEVDSHWLLTGEGSMLKPEQNASLKEPDAMWVDFSNTMQVPLVLHRAQAGFLSGWGDPEYVDDLPTIPWEADREFKGSYVCFEVSGDSMWNENSADSLFERDILLCREIQRQHWQNRLHIHSWKYFVVVHREKGILVKQITDHDTEKGILTLHSLNPYYEDQEVHMDDLIAIFNVVDMKRSARR